MLRKVAPVLTGIIILFCFTGVANAETRYLNTTWASVNDSYYLPMDYSNQLIKAEDCKGCPEIQKYTFSASNTNKDKKPSITMDKANEYLEKDSSTSSYATFDSKGVIFNVGENSVGYPEKPKITLSNIAWYNATERKWGLYDLEISLSSLSYSPEYSKKSDRKAYERNYHLLYIGKTTPFPKICTYGCKRASMLFKFKVSSNTKAINAATPKLLTTTLPKTNVTYEDVDMQQRIGVCESVSVPKLKKHKNVTTEIMAFAKGSKISYEEVDGSRHFFTTEKENGTAEEPSYAVGFAVGGDSSGFHLQFYSSMAKNYDVRSGAFSGFHNSGASMFAKEPNSIYERVNNQLSDSGEKYQKEIKYSSYDVIGKGYSRTVGSKVYTNPSKITKTVMNSSLPSCLRMIELNTNGSDGKSELNAPDYYSERAPEENTLHKFELKVNQNYYKELKKIAGMNEEQDFISSDDWSKAYEQTDKRGYFSVESNVANNNATITHRTFLDVNTKSYNGWQKCEDKTRYATNETSYIVPFPWKDAGIILTHEKCVRGQTIKVFGMVDAHVSTKISKVEIFLEEYRSEPEKWCVITEPSKVESEESGYHKCIYSSETAECQQGLTISKTDTLGEHSVIMKVTFSNIPYSEEQSFTTITLPEKTISVVNGATYDFISVPEETEAGESFFATGTAKCTKDIKINHAEFYIDYDTFSDSDGQIKKEVYSLENSLIKGTNEKNTIKTEEFSTDGDSDDNSRYSTKVCRVVIPTDRNIPLGNHYVYMIIYYENAESPSVSRTGICVKAAGDREEKESSDIHFTSRKYQNLVTTKDYQEILARSLAEDTSELMKRLSEKIFGE